MTTKMRRGITIFMLLVFAMTAFVPVVQAATIVAQPGDNNDTVKDINQMLKSLGYYYGTVSNYYGTSTKAAVKLFQRANGLSDTGIVDQETYNLLLKLSGGSGQAPSPAPDPTPQPEPTPKPQPNPEPMPNPTPKPTPNPGSGIVAQLGDNNETVTEIKTMLKSLGYYYGSISPYYSTSTKYAVAMFQSAKGLKSTGTVDSETYELLKSLYRGNNPTPTPTPTPEPNPKPNPEPQPEPKPEPTPNPTPVAGLTADEQLMFNMVNQERAKAGLKPLQIDMRLVQSARLKSQDLITNNYFSHTSPVYGGFAALIRSYAPDYRYLGENLAGNKSVQGAMTAFMNSSGHRKNILNPNYTHIGIGIVSGGPYGKMYTQHFGG